MANEMTVSCALRFSKGGVVIDSNNGSFNSDVTGEDGAVLTQVTSSVTPAPLNKGSITTPGWIKARNLSSTSAEIIRLATSDPGVAGVYFCKIHPGTEVLFKWDENLTAPYVKADSGSPLLMYELIEA